MHPLSIGIVGTGPAALMAGTALAESGQQVHFFDQSKAPARKFLVAGHGGFNLTHSENIEEFISKYDRDTMRSCVSHFTNCDFIDFLKKIGIETYVGSSGKIFPVRGVKPIEVLNAWLDHLKRLGAQFDLEHRLVDFDASSITLDYKGALKEYTFDRIIFALGGGSWSRTGSDGKWTALFRAKGIPVMDLAASNSGFELAGVEKLESYAGQSIKNCKAFSDSIEKYGDVVLTDYGIEGAPIYALNREYRNDKKIYLDLKPTLLSDEIENKLAKGVNVTEALKAMKLSKGAVGILKAWLSKEEFLDRSALAPRIKKLELPISGIRPLDEVISSVGGISSEAIGPNFELVKYPGIFCVGEMVDWDAPTGGYLIQGCVSSGMKAARSIIDQS